MKLPKLSKIFKSNTLLYWMVGVAILALLLGFLVVHKRIKTTPPQTSSSDNQNSDQAQDQEVPSSTDQPLAPADLSGWKVYTNEKYGFSLQYPPNLLVGTVSKNSALGTFQVPVKGFHVGPLVFVVLKDAALKAQAQDYFNASYDLALHPQVSVPGEPSIACTIDKVSNTQVINIKSVSCVGEGGPARYAYIKGSSYDVFVDGYTKGYDTADNGTLTKDTDYVNILSTFKFSTSASSSTDSTKTTQAPIQTFTIAADDNSATPSEISVPAGTIVEITFNVAAQNVYYGGLDFRSSVVNSGTIHAGESKTISFTANKSFSFTPYWPSSSVAKGYTIKVNVQ